MIPIFGVLLFELLYFLPVFSSTVLLSLFSYITLPLGYVFLLVPLLGSLVYFYHTLDREKYISKVFLINYVFSCFYIFLWAISAFGVVWYGIAMYGAFICMISAILYYIEQDTHKSSYL